jgi:predicted RNA-binding protein associated with RNAse of E/G family
VVSSPGGSPEIRIHYLRPPDRLTVYRQRLVHDDGQVKITLARDLPFDPPLRIQGRVALERGSDAVWFTFPGAWHDIGRFYRADGTFAGLYANVITPCIFQPGGDWETTDLFLDLWIPAAPAPGSPGSPAPRDEARDAEALQEVPPRLLDEDELDRAEAEGHLSRRLATLARGEASSLLVRAAEGSWPPDVVHAWPRRRALQVMETTPGGKVSSRDSRPVARRPPR